MIKAEEVLIPLTIFKFLTTIFVFAVAAEVAIKVITCGAVVAVLVNVRSRVVPAGVLLPSNVILLPRILTSVELAKFPEIVGVVPVAGFIATEV